MKRQEQIILLLKENGKKYTAKEIAEQFGVSRQYVYLLASIAGYKTKAVSRTSNPAFLSAFLNYEELEKKLQEGLEKGIKKGKILEEFGINYNDLYQIKAKLKNYNKL